MSVNDHRTGTTTELFNVLQGSTDKSATFVFGNEDHTLGNVLRHILISKQQTEFCGYSVPHPYEPKMHIRLQTSDVPAIQILKSGLNDLEETANILDDHFIEALSSYKKSTKGTKSSR